MKDSLRSQAADALRSAQESSSETSPKKSGVKIIDLEEGFVDSEAKRKIQEQSLKIRKTLGYS
jgi:hypothetical protein